MAGREPSTEWAFNGAPERYRFSGLLFDMDGTIIDSTEAVVNNWKQIAEDIGVDPNIILATSHGRRTIDVLAKLEPSKANWDYVRQVEAMLPKLYKDSAHALPGARELLTALDEADAPWIIVTSGSLPLVTGWLDALSLPRPKHLVTAEDVKDGKPDPACYVLGREKLGTALSESSAPRVLVLEDAPAGIKSGYGAACEVIAVSTSHAKEELAGMPEAKWVVKDLDSVKFVGYNKETREVEVEISSYIQPKVESI